MAQGVLEMEDFRAMSSEQYLKVTDAYFGVYDNLKFLKESFEDLDNKAGMKLVKEMKALIDAAGIDL